MNKIFIGEIVRNIIKDVGNQFDIELVVTSPIEFDWSVDFKITSDTLLSRGLTVRYVSSKNDGYSVSHGIHSPSDTRSDLIQQIICGRVAERLLVENLKKN